MKQSCRFDSPFEDPNAEVRQWQAALIEPFGLRARPLHAISGRTQNRYRTISGHNVQKQTDFAWHKHVQTYVGARETDKKWVCRVWGALMLIFVHIDSGSKKYAVSLPLHPVWLTFTPWPPRRFRASIHYGQVIKTRFVPRYIAMVFPRTEIQLPTEHSGWTETRGRERPIIDFFLKRKDASSARSMHREFSTEYNIITWPWDAP